MSLNSECKTYLFSYEHNGASWLLELKASDPEDAKKRIRRLQYATYDGELKLKLETPRTISRLLSMLKAFLGRATP